MYVNRLFDPDEVPQELLDCFEEVETECGAPWERVVEKVGSFQRRWSTTNSDGSPYTKQDSYQNIYQPSGWQSTCSHGLEPVPAVVFDPFAGSGTTLLVARQLGRHGIGTDLSMEYLKLAKDRTGLTAWDEWQHGKKDGASVGDLPLFSGSSHD